MKALELNLGLFYAWNIAGQPRVNFEVLFVNFVTTV